MPFTSRARTTAIGLGLAAVVLAVYARAGRNDFVDLDDGAYVYDNPRVRDGLSLEGLVWALRTTHSANWHPLTWLSHMLDVELFGLDAGGHHWTSILLHAANTVLLFLVLGSLTGAPWRSALAAALFGLHPLHVESVAWVAERKDVLSTFFWLATMGAYARYARGPTTGRYLAVAGCLALGLLSKPMLVTLPFVLLLLDFWPLRRWAPPGRAAGPGARALRPLVVEKLPLLVLSAASCVVTYKAQSAGGATGLLDVFPPGERVANAVVAYAQYLVKTVWPASLAVFYPHPSSVGETVPALRVLAAAAALALLSLLAGRQAGRRPHLAVGWAWYLGTLVPVIGIVQVGSQAMADRYTYVPLIGVFVAVAWLAGDLAGDRRRARLVLAAAAAAILLALSAATAIQTGCWRDGSTLYRRALEVTRGNWLAWNNLGNRHLARGELDRALDCFQEALRIRPVYEDAWYNAGVVHSHRSDHARAIPCYRRSLDLDPGNIDGWNNLGVAHMNLRQYAEAVACYESALRLDPDHALALQNLALTFALQSDRRRFSEVERRLREVDPARADELRSQVGGGR